jgi:hypothetical protein
MVMGGSYSNLYRILYACYERFDDIYKGVFIW